jgi:hypothetical protein
MRAWALLVIGATGLAACVSQQEQQQKKMANLNPFIGQFIAAYMAVRGPLKPSLMSAQTRKCFNG